jgi:AcrR family transcriptional regulator
MFRNSHFHNHGDCMKTIYNQTVTRRSPRQDRAIVKLELMFEAALQILESEDLGPLTTNRIAAVAGVSIGTLYQYFPDKDALLLALVKREVTRTFERLGTVTHPARMDSPQDQVRAAVRIMLSALDGRLHARKRLMQALARSGLAHLIDEEIMTHGLNFMTTSFSASGGLTGVVPNLDFIQRFVLARAVSGALRAALLHDENLLQDPGFEDALCRLILGYLMTSPAVGITAANESAMIQRN